MWHRILRLVIKDFHQFMRDRLLVSFIVVGPLLQLAMLASVTRHDVAHLPMAVVDYDRSPASRALVTKLDNLRELDAVYHLDDVEEAGRLLDRGQVWLAVVIPPGFAAHRDGEPPPVQLLIDGSNIFAAAAARRAAEGAINHFLACRGRVPFELRPAVRFNPTFDAGLYTIPAQLSLIVYTVTMLVSAVSIVREREVGTLEQLLVTPLRRIEIIVGKAVLPLGVAFADFLLMLALVVGRFDIPLRGSPALLVALTLLFIAIIAGWGLIISALSTTQQQAIMYVFIVGILNVAFSGYLVAVENMPPFLRLASHLFPIRHYMEIVRAVMLKGATLANLWPQVRALLALGALSLAAALASLRRRLD